MAGKFDPAALPAVTPVGKEANECRHGKTVRGSRYANGRRLADGSTVHDLVDWTTFVPHSSAFCPDCGSALPAVGVQEGENDG